MSIERLGPDKKRRNRSEGMTIYERSTQPLRTYTKCQQIYLQLVNKDESVRKDETLVKNLQYSLFNDFCLEKMNVQQI